MCHEVFISYPREQHRYLDDLRAELSTLEQEGRIKVFDDRDIAIGEDWEKTLERKLREANMVLLLLSPAFYASAWCKFERGIALERREREGIDVIPILVDEVKPGMDPEIERIQGLPIGYPANLKPVSQWAVQEQAWRNVVWKLRKRIEQSKKPEGKLQLKPFSNIVVPIQQAILEADHLWLLCRTGLGLWNDFGTELDKFINKWKKTGDGVANQALGLTVAATLGGGTKRLPVDNSGPPARTRFIFVQPRGEAFLSTRHQFVPWHLDPEQTFDRYKASFERLYEALWARTNEGTIPLIAIKRAFLL